MSPREAVMDIAESVQALLSSKECVIERFYDRLLADSPELRRHFANRDMRVQASMLTMAAVSVEAYYSHGFPAIEHYLKVLGNRHFHEGVRADDYPKFQAAFLATLEEFFADDWQPVLAEQWRKALELAVSTMLKGYDRTLTM